MVPAQAARQILSDRLSGAFEVLLCTPATPKVIAQGIWLALRRNYLLPVAAVMLLSTVLMISGYVTFGFGGLMDPTDRPRWVIAWSTGIVFLRSRFLRCAGCRCGEHCSSAMSAKPARLRCCKSSGPWDSLFG
jgi:hypothetical protein